MTDREKLIELLSGKSVDTADDVKYVADYLIANGVTVNEWRPASEPPKEAGEYIVMIKRGKVATTLFFSKCHDGWYEFNDDDFAFPYDVTHWMPLPQPPKEVE